MVHCGHSEVSLNMTLQGWDTVLPGYTYPYWKIKIYCASSTCKMDQEPLSRGGEGCAWHYSWDPLEDLRCHIL